MPLSILASISRRSIGASVSVSNALTGFSAPAGSGSAITSTITISGCGRNASASSQISVDISHTWRGDLRVDLVAPDGTTINLKPTSAGDSADNVVTTYTKDLSAEQADGTWRLKVQDVYYMDTGKINSWSITS